MPVAQNISGKRFGRLIAIRLTGRSNSGGRLWFCQCDCGGSTETTVGYLNIGKTRSCGCLQKESARIFVQSRTKPDSAFRRAFAEYKQNATKDQRAFTLTHEEFRNITQEPCDYCGAVRTRVKRSAGEEYTYNGIDRVNSLVGYEMSNCVSCCWTCNQMKSTFGRVKFLNAVQRISEHQQTKEVT